MAAHKVPALGCGRQRFASRHSGLRTLRFSHHCVPRQSHKWVGGKGARNEGAMASLGSCVIRHHMDHSASINTRFFFQSCSMKPTLLDVPAFGDMVTVSDSEHFFLFEDMLR